MADFTRKNNQLEKRRWCAMNLSFFTNTLPWLGPMLQFFLAVIAILLSWVGINAWQRRGWDKQKAALNAWEFDAAYTPEVLLKYPHLNAADVAEAFKQLRLYFFICWKYEDKLIPMPSRLVDLCWHIFILDTRSYIQFCTRVFDRYVHHEPPLLVSATVQTEAIDIFTQTNVSTPENSSIETQESKLEKAHAKRCLVAAARVYQCALLFEEKPAYETSVEVENTAKVPALFSIDDTMDISDGFRYSAEYLKLLSKFDVKDGDAAMAGLDGAGGGIGASCGDGGACGCGGST
jgi:hypothetical protein